MAAERFDTAVRMLGGAGRRRLLTGGIGATLAGLLGRRIFPDHPIAAAAACAKVGKACRHAAQCCSGVCTGKHGKKKCRGHDAGTCLPGQDLCTDPFPMADRCNNHADCGCIATTAGTSYCGYIDGGGCAVCARDADCVALGFPPGSACAVVNVGVCAGECASGTFCVVPCSAAPPPA